MILPVDPVATARLSEMQRQVSALIMHVKAIHQDIDELWAAIDLLAAA